MISDATVFVVDDDAEALRSMRWLLESEGLAVETYLSGEEFLAAYARDRPGCLLLDLCMPEMDGLELQRRLASRGAHLPVVFVSGRGDVAKCTDAMKGGAVDFLEKPADDAKVLAVVHLALEKDRRRRSVDATHPEIAARIARLTPRERETMGLLAEGSTIKQIAAQLDIGFQTAAKHRTRVLGKMRVANEAELVRLLKDYPQWQS
jgi:two-component system, LuxR family, response regulator FixJ